MIVQNCKAHREIYNLICATQIYSIIINMPTDQLSTGATGEMPCTDQLSTGETGNMQTDQLDSTGTILI